MSIKVSFEECHDELDVDYIFDLLDLRDLHDAPDRTGIVSSLSFSNVKTLLSDRGVLNSFY